MGVASLLEKAREFAERNEVFSNEIRILLYGILVARGGEATWSQLKEDLERILGRYVNPNLMAFHLRRLGEAGVVGRQEMGREVRYVVKKTDYAGVFSPVIDGIRKVVGKG